MADRGKVTTLPITTLFIDVGGVLLTNGWDHLARKRAARHFKLDWAEMDQRHRLVFETHEEGKLSFEEYLGWVVFFEKRLFTRNQFRDFMFAQSKPFPKMLDLVARLKKVMGLAKTVPKERLVFRHIEAMEMAWREDAEEEVFCRADRRGFEAG
jgi:hypothetical protein